MTIVGFKRLLTEGAFFRSVASHRSSGNDPLEGEGLICRSHVTEELKGNPELSEYLRNWFAKLRQPKASLPQEYGGGGLNEEDGLFDFMSRARCAWCWYAANHESFAMWQNFAKGGVAIKTRIDCLQQALPGERDFIIGDIRYFDRSPNRETHPDRSVSLRPFFTKGSEFHDENEVRVVTRCQLGAEGVTIPIQQPELLIRGIVIYPHPDRKTFETTRDVVVDLLRAQFGNYHVSDEPGGSGVLRFTVGSEQCGPQIRVEPSSIQEPLYRQNDLLRKWHQHFCTSVFPIPEEPGFEGSKIDSFPL